MFLNNITHGWIGEIPSRWELKRIKHIFYISKNISDAPDEKDVLSLTFGGVIKRDISTNEGQLPESYKGYSKINPDDIVMNPMDLKSGWVDKSEFEGIISPSYYVLKPYSNSVDIQYFTYQFQRCYRERIFFPFGQGISYDYRWGLGKETLLNFPIIFPPLSEQKQISQFLDRKTQQIDELIEKTKQKIELLKEKRTSFINRCVTKGLNPNMEMKDSGVDWIGEIPTEWSLQPLKYLKKDEKDSMVDGPFGSSVDVSRDYGDFEIPVVRTVNINDNGFSSKNLKFMRREKYEELKRHNVLPGDILFSKVGTIGNVCLFPPDYSEGILSTTGSCRVRVDERKGIKEYIVYLLVSSKRHFQFLSGQNVQPFLNMTTIKNVRFPIPTLPEQQQIVEYLDAQTQKIDTAIEKEIQRIELLKEYRQSLISEIVTGKIDIRDYNG